MDDKEFAELELASLFPSSPQWPSDLVHQKALLAAVNEATVLMRQAHTKFAGIKANKDLTPEAKARQRVELASALSAKLDASPTRARAREACEYVLGKYEAQITSKLQKADDTQTVGVHAQIRAQLHDLKDAKERMSVLAKHGSDLTLISAALSAPAYVSGLTSAEISLLRSNLEKHADPAVIKERKFVQDTLAEIERGVRAVRSRIANEGGLHANAA